MTTAPADTLTTELTAINSAVTQVQALVSTYGSNAPVAASTISQQCMIIANAVATIQSTIAAVTAPAPTPTPVPVIPVPTPTPVPPLAPINPSTTTPILQDSFTQYANTAALQAAISTTAGGSGTGKIMYQDGWLAPLVSLDTSVLYNNHPTMKFSMPGGVKDCPKLIAQLPQGYDTVWFRTKVMFSKGFTTTGVSGPGNAFKLLAWGHDTYDGTGRLEIANTNQYQLYWNIQAKNTGTLIGGGKFLIDGNITTEWSDGVWHDYILKIDRSNGTQGFASGWWSVDGQAPNYKGITPAETMNDGSQLPKINSVQWAIEFNQVRAAGQSQAIWIGHWEVLDGSVYPNPYGL